MITPESPSLETKNENPVVSPASDATFLATWLVDRDTACPLCEYNIRGLTTPRCPECGQALRLSVALAEPYLKAWIALIAGLLPPAGIGTVFIFVFSNELMHEGTRMFGRAGFFNMPIGVGFALLHLVICVPLSILAIIFRRRFLCWSRGLQSLCASLAWVAVVISIVMISLLS